MTQDTTTTPASGAADLPEALINIAREIEALKRYCGMDPESAIAIQNGRYMAISSKIRALAAGRATAAQAVVPAGWKLVPVDATDEMVRATDEVNFENGDTDGTIHNVWNVMIAAAPAQPAAQQGAAYAAQQASTVTNYTTLGAAMRAIRQSIQMIGDPEDECMRAVKRVLRGAVIIVEDSGDEVAAPAAPAQPAVEASRFGSPELQAMIIARCVEKDQADSVQEDAARESEYRRGYRHGYEQRDAEVRGAMA